MKKKIERWMMQELSVYVRMSFDMYDKYDVDFVEFFFLVKID